MPERYNNRFDEQISRALYRIRVQPDARLWPAIEQRLSRRKSFLNMVTGYVLAILLLLFPSGIIHVSIPNTSAPWREPTEEVVGGEFGHAAGVLPRIPAKFPVAAVRQAAMGVDSGAAVMTQNAAPELLAIPPAVLETPEPLPVIARAHPPALQAGVCPRNWSAGVTLQLNNHWLMDARALSSGNLRYHLTLGAAYGIYAGMDWHRNWGVQAALLHTLGSGQRYDNLEASGRTLDMDFIRKQIALSYLHVPVMLQYHNNRYSQSLQRPLRLNLSAGLQYGRLINYSMDHTPASMENDIVMRRNEWAALAGIDWNLFNQDGTIYTIGLRASVGTPVFKPMAGEYYELQRGRNVTLSLHAGVGLGRRCMVAVPESAPGRE